MAEKGSLRVQCFNGDTLIPVDRTKIVLTSTNELQAENIDIELKTDSSGQSEVIELEAPPISYSEEPTGDIPYSLYDLKIIRDGFEPITISGVQIYPGQVALQNCNLKELSRNRAEGLEIIKIQPNRLVGNYPNKIPEEVDKPLPPPTSGVVLAKPVVPETITIHAGMPDDTTAANYKVAFKDYIKNVASCEIYSTWPESTIRANVYAIVSFTLNRIYTEWYRGKGKNFDITSSTAYDHAFSYGRNVYENISAIVDEVFSTYVRKFGRKQPLLTQYCDGQNVQCPGWMTQWGSKYLGDKGKGPYDILTHFYGTDIELVRAEIIKGTPKSYPGYNLTVGSSGEEVRVIQNQLNTIAKNYPLIPKVVEDGVYEARLENSVKVFQGIFSLPQTGIVDYATWYEISNVYVGVTKIAELRRSCNKKIFTPPIPFEMLGNIPIPNFEYFED